MAEEKDRKHKNETDDPVESIDGQAESQSLVEQLQQSLEEAQKTQEEHVAKAQRALADYSNLKKRFEKEREEIATYANELMFMRLLPVIDNLDRAVFYASDDEQKSSLYQGVKMTLQQAHEVLQSVGFSQILAEEGEQFDPHVHEAVEMVAGEQAKILGVLRPGYKLDDKVIRPVQVKVGNGEKQ